ncbi:hypothetical protein GCM10010231_03310 [Streptomyces sindenensis]|nr:hypothetical protein GCM10010231_03310 [Streptomyces sindenensis]
MGAAETGVREQAPYVLVARDEPRLVPRRGEHPDQVPTALHRAEFLGNVEYAAPLEGKPGQNGFHVILCFVTGGFGSGAAPPDHGFWYTATYPPEAS